MGTPKFDDEGYITNAIVYCHFFNGSYSSVYDLPPITSENGPFDLNDYFIISISALGYPESCSPSTTGLKYDFPSYTIKDKVNFKRQFLKENYKIKKLCGIFGIGLGGYDAFTWACEYPDEMDFLVVIDSSYKTNGYRYVISKTIDGIIESSDDYYKNIYSDAQTRNLVAVNKLIYSNFYSKGTFQNMTNDEIDVFMEEFVDEGLFFDIYDLKYRNDSIMYYDITDKLSNVKAKTIVFYPEEDLFHSPEFDALPLKDLIDDCEVTPFYAKEDISYKDDFVKINDDLIKFMNKLYKK